MLLERKYIPEATALQFHNDRDKYLYRFVRGVPGSGKSVMCLMEPLLWGIDQPPSNDNIRRTRFAIIRATYPALKTTTVKSFENWYPRNLWPVKQSVPYSCRVNFGMPDGTEVDIEFVFLAVETKEDIDKLKSLELTGAFINEAFQVDREVIQAAFERTGRYPSANLGAACKRRGVWADTNSPNSDHWWAKDEANPPEGWKFYIQPAPLIRRRDNEGRTLGWDPNPLAENIVNLGGGNLEKGYDYYRQQIPGMREDQLRVNIENKFGSLFTGVPVYQREWDDSMVAGGPIDVARGHEVIIGIDTSGLNPAAVFMQLVNGTLVVLDEIVALDTPFEEFINDLLVPQIGYRYARNNLIAVVDPSNPKNAKTGTTAQQDLMGKQIVTVTAPSNNPVFRVNAVKYFLQRRNGIVIDPRARILIDGFKGGYSYGEIRGSKGQTRTTPDKNDFAHPHDGLQYGCLYLRRASLGGSLNEKADKHRRRRRSSLLA